MKSKTIGTVLPADMMPKHYFLVRSSERTLVGWGYSQSLEGRHAAKQPTVCTASHQRGPATCYGKSQGATPLFHTDHHRNVAHASVNILNQQFTPATFPVRSACAEFIF